MADDWNVFSAIWGYGISPKEFGVWKRIVFLEDEHTMACVHHYKDFDTGKWGNWELCAYENDPDTHNEWCPLCVRNAQTEGAAMKEWLGHLTILDVDGYTDRKLGKKIFPMRIFRAHSETLSRLAKLRETFGTLVGVPVEVRRLNKKDPYEGGEFRIMERDGKMVPPIELEKLMSLRFEHIKPTLDRLPASLGFHRDTDDGRMYKLKGLPWRDIMTIPDANELGNRLGVENPTKRTTTVSVGAEYGDPFGEEAEDSPHDGVTVGGRGEVYDDDVVVVVTNPYADEIAVEHEHGSGEVDYDFEQPIDY